MKFCPDCGSRYKNDAWPRECQICSGVQYGNPIAVAVALVPVEYTGLLAVVRNIEPAKGKLALPGGFVNRGESWQKALSREVFEETGIGVIIVKDIFHAASTPDNSKVLLFGLCEPITNMEFEIAYDKVSAGEYEETRFLHLLLSPKELAFSSHTEAVQKWFDR